MKGLCILALVCVAAASQSGDICEQPLDPGLCLAYIPQYGYNSTSGECQLFIYGGCPGNDNRFETLEACEQACVNDDEDDDDDDDEDEDEDEDEDRDRRSGAGAILYCRQEPETGPCKGSFPRFAYNYIDNKCHSFIYGGCEGNANNFESERECMATCGSRAKRSEVSVPMKCKLPKKSGPCYGYFPYFYYNSQRGQCERFIYGGCNGNANRFETRGECMKTCASPNKRNVASGLPRCKQPPNPGPCKAYFPSYFHNPLTGKCQKFVYGGCGGNQNRFETRRECWQACRRENY